MERYVIISLSCLLVASSLDLAPGHLGLAVLYGLVGVACAFHYGLNKPWTDRMLLRIKADRSEHDRMLAGYRRRHARYLREARDRGSK